MSKIQDGSGSGRNAYVDTSFRLLTSSITEPGDHRVNIEDGKVWSLSFKDIDPTGEDDYFMYIKNTSTDVLYSVTDVQIASTVAGQFEINAVSGIASGGSALTPVSRKIGSVATPGVTVETGTDITGLSSEGTLFLLTLEADKMLNIEKTSHIILQPGQAIGLLWGESTGVLSGTVALFAEPNGI